jgi:acyl-CoA thioesterase FadM
MNLWLRLLLLFLADSLWRPGLSLLATGRLPLRVLPSDLDLLGHMTNARYFSVLDLGRLDLLFRSGLLGLVLRRRWAPVVAGCDVRFRRALRPFERFWVESRLAGWDERWLYMEQTIHCRRGVAASAMVRGSIVADGQTLAPATVMAAAGLAQGAPDLPERFRAWRDAEPVFHDA